MDNGNSDVEFKTLEIVPELSIWNLLNEIEKDGGFKIPIKYMKLYTEVRNG